MSTRSPASWNLAFSFSQKPCRIQRGPTGGPQRIVVVSGLRMQYRPLRVMSSEVVVAGVSVGCAILLSSHALAFQMLL